MSPLYSDTLRFTASSICTANAPITFLKGGNFSGGLHLGYHTAMDKSSVLDQYSLPSFSNNVSLVPGEAYNVVDSELAIYVGGLATAIREWDPVVVEIVERVACFAMQGAIVIVCTTSYSSFRALILLGSEAVGVHLVYQSDMSQVLRSEIASKSRPDFRQQA
jgi:hypothetical protein